LAGPQEEPRAGSQLLSLFENPLNARVLRAHSGGPIRLAEIRKGISWAPESTIRASISTLCDEGALVRERAYGSQAVTTQLTPAGHELFFLADVVESWLARCPAGPIVPDSDEGKAAVKALAGGWSTTLIREMANRPTTLVELSRAIPDIPYPVLERRLHWMKLTGQIEPVLGQGRGTPYVVTEWLRRAIAPISVSGRTERRHFATGVGPITDIEVEAAFLMAIPLVSLRPRSVGSCRLVAQTDLTAVDDESPKLAGVTVEVERGEVVSCLTDVDSEPLTWGVGTADAWLEAVIDGQIEELRIGGTDPQLGLDLVAGLHLALFPSA
jgi:DNA-binding HxlR family transcriptional regulator